MPELIEYVHQPWASPASCGTLSRLPRRNSGVGFVITRLDFTSGGSTSSWAATSLTSIAPTPGYVSKLTEIRMLSRIGSSTMLPELLRWRMKGSE
jgi:hypothetical protein